MTLAERIEETFEKTRGLNEKFQNGCEICGVKNSRKGMTFHHHWYLDTDRKYSDFPKTQKGKLDYYIDLFCCVKENPDRFALLCVRHHYDVERSLRYGDTHWDKLSEFRKLSKEKR